MNHTLYSLDAELTHRRERIRDSYQRANAGRTGRALRLALPHRHRQTRSVPMGRTARAA